MKKLFAIFLFMIAIADGHAASTITIDGQRIHVEGSGVVVVDGQIVEGRGALPVIQGSGNVLTESRSIPDFDGLILNVAARVRVRQGPPPELNITADDNIVPILETEVKKGVLTISARNGFVTRNPVVIDLQTPELSAATINGSGTLNLESLVLAALDLKVAGSATVKAEGRTEALSAAVNGSGELLLADLQVKNCSLVIQGSGRAELAVADRLTTRINGSGEVVLQREPARLESRIFGSGKVTRKGMP